MMKFRHIVLIFVIFSAFSCSKQLSEEDSASLTIKVTSAENTPSNQFLSVRASGDWTLKISFSDQTEYDFSPWAYFGRYTDVDSITLSGHGDGNLIQFNWTGNKSPLIRTATITLISGNQSSEVVFSQNGTNKSGDMATHLESDELGDWMELPQLNEGKNLYYYHHPMTIAGKVTRNFSYGWDPKSMVALWVAYPLNSYTIGSGSRSNEWGLDPKVPKEYQPVLFSPYKGYYDRGHQCPSADRLNYDANVETFYGTNMTPQRNELNAAAWGVLEGMVRKWARQFDTLYVVTGCVIDGSTEKAYDNEGKAITVPTGYYKALLGYKRGGTVANTGSTGGYTAIGFFFEHRRYDQSPSSIMKVSMSIDELEDLTGLNFFYNLEKQSRTISNEVESTVSNWWANNS